MKRWPVSRRPCEMSLNLLQPHGLGRGAGHQGPQTAVTGLPVQKQPICSDLAELCCELQA